jgi:hypothetical protein
LKPSTAKIKRFTYTPPFGALEYLDGRERNISSYDHLVTPSQPSFFRYPHGFGNDLRRGKYSEDLVVTSKRQPFIRRVNTLPEDLLGENLPPVLPKQ